MKAPPSQPAALIDRLHHSWRTALLPLPRVLQVLGLLLLVLALARPVKRVETPAERVRP